MYEATAHSRTSIILGVAKVLEVFLTPSTLPFFLRFSLHSVSIYFECMGRMEYILVLHILFIIIIIIYIPRCFVETMGVYRMRQGVGDLCGGGGEIKGGRGRDYEGGSGAGDLWGAGRIDERKEGGIAPHTNLTMHLRCFHFPFILCCSSLER